MSEKELREVEEDEIVRDTVSEVTVKDYSPTVLVGFRMPTPMYEALEKYREEHRLRRSEALNEALAVLLKKKEETIDKRYIQKLIADSTKESWGTEIFDIRLVGKLALERNIVGDENWTDEHLKMILERYSEYAEEERLEESDVESDLRFFATAIKVERKRVLRLYEESGEEGHSGEASEEEEWGESEESEESWEEEESW